MNRSMSPRAQPLLRTFGGSILRMGWNAQWVRLASSIRGDDGGEVEEGWEIRAVPSSTAVTP